ncbi:hypothetical protein EDD68_10768 [Melghiribacillus thermohalophilus]|uniref:Uncharacterized protein n=1 Tax=Melghiribacillus thermohalophilus TaxID=1324956 RepID=A0A4R3N3M7_9BACI|nr:hypothetical protein [Melghiribacillus thermohalophilus]TCT23354.1 hypothetical protein EDD68_10768 [Melghiribacillus thermohalophilus]
MSNQHEVTKDILLKVIDSGYIPKSTATASGAEDALRKNLERITIAYKEIFKAVNDPLE